MESRYEYLSDTVWLLICCLIPGSVNWRGRAGVDTRRFLNAVVRSVLKERMLIVLVR